MQLGLIVRDYRILFKIIFDGIRTRQGHFNNCNAFKNKKLTSPIILLNFFAALSNPVPMLPQLHNYSLLLT